MRLAILTALLLSCHDKDSDSLMAEASPSELIPTVIHVTFHVPDEDGSSFVEYGLDDALDRVTPAFAGNTLDIALLGLKAGRTWSWRAVTLSADGSRQESSIHTIDVASPPSRLPVIELQASEPDSEVADGFVLVAITDSMAPGDAETDVVILDGDGDYVWWTSLPDGHVVVSPAFGAFAPVVMWDDYFYELGAEEGSAVHFTRLDGTSQVDVPTLQGHHMAIEPEPGVLAWIASDFRDSTDLSDWILTDIVYEAPIAQALQPRTVLNLYDDYFGGAFTHPCLHTTTSFDFAGYTDVVEWTHSNSLLYSEPSDAYFLYVRYIDALLKIDRPTGEVLWQLGGPNSDFTGPDGQPLWNSSADTINFSHGHLSQLWEGGFVVFDNASHTGQRSGFVEYSWDESTMRVAQEFVYRDPAQRFLAVLGDVRKLPGGNYLSAWTKFGEITEVSPSGEVLWKVSAAPKQVARVQWVDDLYAVGTP